MDELDVSLCLHRAAHDAEGPEQPTVLDEHARNERVEGAPPGAQLVRVPGLVDEAGAAVLEDDARVARDDAGAEALVEALDEGDRVPVLVDAAEVGRPAPRRRARVGGARADQTAPLREVRRV